MLGQETIPDGEAESIRRILDASRAMYETDERPVRREQHPKHHGCVRADFVVEPGLPPEYRVGLFREPRTYPAWVRFSNGGQRDDTRADAHGMAIKLMGVEGPKALDAERDETTHDFVLVDNPVFFIRNPADYAEFSEAFSKTTGKVPSTLYSTLGFLPDPIRKLVMLVVLYYVPKRMPAVSLLLKFLSKKPLNPLMSQYWSTTPYHFGEGKAVKYTALPETLATGSPRNGSKDYLGSALAESLRTKGATFEFQVQFQLDVTSTPLEDPTVAWPSPFKTVARIVIPAQEFRSPEQMAFCEHLSYTPWHALAEHRPLGGINRVRKLVYAELSATRHDANGVPRREPRPDDPPIGPTGR